MSWTRLLNHANTFDEIRNDLQLTHDEVKQMNSEKEESKLRLEAREREISSLKSQLAAARDENSAVKEERNAARVELDFLKSEALKRNHKEETCVDGDVVRVESARVESLEKERDDLRQENESLEQDLTSTQKELSTTRESLMMKEKELEATKISVQGAVNAATESLTITINEINGRLAVKESEAYAMMNMISAAREEVQGQQRTINEMTIESTRMSRRLGLDIMQEKAKNVSLEKSIEKEKIRTEFELHKFLNCEESLRKLKVESTERIRCLVDQVQSASRNLNIFMAEVEEKKKLCAELESRNNLVLQERENLSQRCSSLLSEGNQLYTDHETLKETHRVTLADLRNEIESLKRNDAFLLKTENEHLKTQLCEQNVELKKQANIALKNFNKSRYSRTVEKLFLSTPGWEDIVKLWKQNPDGNFSPLSYAEYNTILKERNVTWNDTAFWSQYLSISMLRTLNNRTAIVDAEQGSTTECGVTDFFADVGRVV